MKFIVILMSLLYTVTSFALNESYFKAKSYQSPSREHAIVITKEGYYPSHLSIFEGESLKLFLANNTKDPSCLFLPAKELFLSNSAYEMTEAKVTFEKPGEYKFYCPTGKIKGSITVLEKVSIEEKIDRSLASENRDKRFWVPRGE